MPLLPPRLLSILDALHIRVPLRTAVFRTIDLVNKALTPVVASRINSLARQKAHELSISKRPIRVGFLAINPAQFVYQNLYETMSRDKDFDPCVIVCPDWVNAEHGTNESLKRLFTDKGMQVATSIDPDNPPDMVFFPNFDDHVFSGVISLRKSYDKILCCSLLYSMGIDNSGAFYVYHPDFRYMWRQYVPCEFYRELATRRGLRKGDNVVCCGSPKSDSIFNTTGKCSYWKDSSHRRKRFIWAPHWSVLTHGRTSNFDRYYKTFIDYLRHHPDIEIVLKPHPLLKARLTDAETKARLSRNNASYEETDCLPTAEAFDAFVSEWRSLPNANYMDGGDYNELFASSDAMILDSISFMAEYMITEKSMCFCVREPLNELQSRLEFNQFGKDLQSAMTIASTWDEISAFIDRIVAEGDDGLIARRRQVIEKHLSVNKGHVCQFIADDIKHALGR